MARNSNFGKNLRALREDRKMTQARLAAALDITTATVSHWENRGTSPNSKEAIEQLCSVFDVTENDLFGLLRQNASWRIEREDKASCRFWLAADHRSRTRWRAMPSVRA